MVSYKTNTSPARRKPWFWQNMQRCVGAPSFFSRCVFFFGSDSAVFQVMLWPLSMAIRPGRAADIPGGHNWLGSSLIFGSTTNNNYMHYIIIYMHCIKVISMNPSPIIFTYKP